MSTTKDDRYLELNPDAFTRFYICKEILKKDFGKKPIKILDVGGGSKYFRSALLQDKLPYELTVIDILPKPEAYLSLVKAVLKSKKYQEISHLVLE